MPNFLLGDDYRIKYLLSSLLENANQRNKNQQEFPDTTKEIKVAAYMSADSEICIEDVYQTFTCGQMTKKVDLIVTVTDSGCRLKENDIKKLIKEWTLQHVVKGMGGKLEAHSNHAQTRFILTLPCKSS